jgi:tetratricopeptide (TPR) repeat protein
MRFRRVRRVRSVQDRAPVTRPSSSNLDRLATAPFVFGEDTQRFDPVHRMRIAISAVKAAPDDLEARAALGTMLDDRTLREPLAVLLADEARAASQPAVAAALFEHLADLYEELDQPLDAIAAMEAVIANVSDCAELHDRLAWMYRRAGAWTKSAAAYERVGELATDERGRAALRAAARLYRDHNQPERAASVLYAIVARRAGDEQAWRELDEVLSELGRWRELADVRATRASKATGVERAALLRSQARALEQAGEIEAAAGVVEEAATHAPDDLSGLIDHADVLMRGGRHGEATALLRARLDEALDRDAPSDQIAGIRLRLVGALDDADDRGAAAELLEELLVEAPDYLPALERAAAFAAPQDARTHATALLRYASALPDVDPAIVIAAARRFRDANDHEAAVRAFERASELGGDVDLELEEARGSMIAERARIAAIAGDVAGAERRLRAILAGRFSLDAHLALVDVLSGAGRLAEAAEHLSDTLNRIDAPGAVLAPLVHRHAIVHQALGNDDDAHRLLHEAHRLSRRDLAITLALGESCFQRRLWREAARHLGSLADHPDVPKRHREVAIGLVHAALAETRSLRPGNAAAHLDAAVRIDPACGPAWHALAEAAIERGDLERAAECLEREAAATLAPSERVRLYDALGDMAHDVLGDPARAERCWCEILTHAPASVLGKLLAIQRKRGATLERAATCLRVAELDAGARKQLLEEAAELFAQGGDHARAVELAQQLLDEHPGDLDSLACAATVAVAAGVPSRVAAWLRQPLGLLDARSLRKPDRVIDTRPRETERAARMAQLWRILADAERALGDHAAARAAYRRATIAAPESDAALAARRALVELSRSETAPVALESSLFVLVEAELDGSDALFLARELRPTAPHDARASYELARVLGAQFSIEDEAFYASHAPRALASDEGYATRLDDAQRRALLADPDDGPLGDVLDLLGDVAALICSDARVALLDADLAGAQRVAITGDSAAAAMLPQIAKAFGGPTTALFTCDRAKRDVSLLLSAPPSIVLGRHAISVRAASRSELVLDADAGLRFELGRVVELARWRRAFATGVSRDEFRTFVAALSALRPGTAATPGARRDAERLHARLPLTHRARLANLLATLPTLDADAYRAACLRAADRAGLLACGDLTVAVERAGGLDQARHLVELAATRGYMAARHALREREERTSPFARV